MSRVAGWQPALVAMATAIGSSATMIVVATDNRQAVGRFCAAAVLLLGFALLAGIERLVAAAAAPALVAVVLGSWTVDSVAWGWSILIGCGWYVATEAALGSIEQRDGAQRSPALLLRRRREIASIVAAATMAGVGALALSAAAPDRTVFVRAIAIVSLLAALFVAGRHLRSSAEAPTET